MEEKKVREFLISEGVSEVNMGSLIKEIRDINKYDDEQEKEKKEYKREPIVIIVNTFGGSAYDAIGLIAAMELSKTPIHTVCLGKAMSAGFMIFISGHKRFIHPLATLMYHTVRGMVWGDIQTISDEQSEMNRLQDILEKTVLKKTNILSEKLEAVRKGKIDWFIDGNDAKKLGCADEILA